MGPSSEVQATSQNDHESTNDHLEGYLLYVVFCGLLLCFFLPDLDQLILTTAIPQIVNEFGALSEVIIPEKVIAGNIPTRPRLQISWIPNAYFLTMASFMIIFGQLLNLLPIKYVIMASIVVFELGSLLCGIASSMNFLLFGRGVAGIGAAGLFVCIIAAISQIATLEKRATLLGIGGATFGFSSLYSSAQVLSVPATGPLVGGAFTQHNIPSHWCNRSSPPKPDNRQGWKVMRGIDYVGAVLVIAMTISFLYPLVAGGNIHPWNSPFITSGVLLALLLTWSCYRGTEAILPLHLLRNRSVIGLLLANCFIWMNSTLGSVYLATWYQAVKGDSPTQSGLNILPFSLVVSSVATFTGIMIGKVGRYWHILVLMPLLGAVGGGLECTTNENTSRARLAGYQILWAVSIGATMQLPMLAVNGFIGQMVGLAMGNALFTNKLATTLKQLAPDAPFDLIMHSIDSIWQLPMDQRTRVIRAYVLSLRFIFILSVPAAGLSTLSALLVRDLRLPTRKSAELVGEASSKCDEPEKSES
ncbi:major facilitator superfamily domain-containing protein [Hysterangium stoloniferum]|nr:major facilitator superfamily domain-containing protein [Hysterangium stoloniferum]